MILIGISIKEDPAGQVLLELRHRGRKSTKLENKVLDGLLKFARENVAGGHDATVWERDPRPGRKNSHPRRRR